MNTRVIPITLLVLALLGMSAGPAFAGGTWYGGEGQLEPSTTYDTAAFMQQYPNDASHPGGVAERVYFNGMLLNDGYGTNLEGGSIRSSLSTYGALLGFWRDCNGDGYIGAKNAPTPYGNWNSGYYPAAGAQIDTTLCRPNGAYNHGGFVDEFRWIGPDAAATNEEVANQKQCDPTDWTTLVAWCLKQWRDPWDVSDPGAKVWGDFNLPDGVGARTGSFTPSYLFQNSTGTLEYVNWFTNIHGILEAERNVQVPDPQNDGEYLVEASVRVLEEDGWESKPNFGDCGGDYSEFGAGPGFAGTDQGTCGMYPLYQVTRLENDSDRSGEDARPLVKVYDTETDDRGGESPCDDTTLPTGEQMADLDPDVNDNPLMDGSLGGTRHNIEEGTGNRKFDGTCGAPDPNNSGTGEEAGPEGKTSVDTVFTFYKDKRLQTASAAGVAYAPADALGVFGGPTSPGGSDWILFATSAGPRWLGNTGYVTVSRVPALEEPEFATFYADIGPDAFLNASMGSSAGVSLPAKAQDAHEYGTLACGGNYDDTPTNREANDYFWICSRDSWGSENYYPGVKYDLRDVDCYDNSLMNTEIAGVPVDLRWQDVDGASGETVRESCASWQS